MAKTYRLRPSAAEYLAGEMEGVREGDTVGFTIPGGVGTTWFHVSELTAVPPPLPPELPVGSVVQCERGYVHIRQSIPSWTGHDGYTSWRRIHADCGGAVHLVPDPREHGPELPYQHTDAQGDMVEVDRDGEGPFIVATQKQGSRRTGAMVRIDETFALAALRATRGKP